MKKFKISDKQYLNIINRSINEAISLKEGEKYVSDKYITDFQKNINAAIQDKLKTDSNLQQTANELGINPNYSRKEKMKMMNQNLESETASISTSMTDKVKIVVNILREVTNSTGGINQIILKKNADSGAYHGLSYADILRVKDYIDSLDLRFLYDTSINPASKVQFNKGEDSKLYKFGIIINRDGTYDDSHFNLNDINKNQTRNNITSKGFN